MRSRYSAFALGDAAYLLHSWDPVTRPALLILPLVEWVGLEVVDRRGGELTDPEGTVTFVARYRAGGSAGALAERSTFRRVEGRWVYTGPSPA